MKPKAAAPLRYTPREVHYTSRTGEERKAAYEHPFAVRLTHWLNAIALVVMAGSGLRIYLAFPAFGDKLPPHDFFRFPGGFSLGGWLAGALQWHFTFMWLFVGAGLFYIGYELITGNWRQVVFTPHDIRGVWPMFRHYFLFGPKPEAVETYNSLQKLAYSITVLLGLLSTLTGLVMYKSAQLAFLVPLLGGYRSVRILHFLSLVGFAAFVPGHLVMVVVHGWNNFQSMLTGWNFKPEYTINVLASPAGNAEPPAENVEPKDGEVTEVSVEQAESETAEHMSTEENAAPESDSKGESESPPAER